MHASTKWNWYKVSNAERLAFQKCASTVEIFEKNIDFQVTDNLEKPHYVDTITFQCIFY